MTPARDSEAAPSFPIAVYALAALNVAVFAHELAFREDEPRNAFINAFALIPFDLTSGIVLAAPAPPTALTLVTSQFLHGSGLHLFSNLLVLGLFGPQVEWSTGHLRFVLLYLLCGVLGGLAQVSVMPESHVPGIGASGAIAGILGAYIVRFPTHDVQTMVPPGVLPHFVRFPAFAIIGLWAVIQFVHGFGTLSSHVLSEQGGGTAYFAHIGGFLAGVFLAFVFVRRPAAGAPQGRRYRYYY